MGKFKSNLKNLMLAKAQRNGEPVTQKQIAEEANVSYPTIQDYYHGNIERVEHDTAERIASVFNCTLGELLEF